MNTMRLPHRQSGAVAIMTAFAIVLLIAVIGLVVDLGYLYTRKTELQNASDAAALAGARELNGTTAGVTAAAAQAIALAAANSSDLDATPVAIANANIEFGPLPSGPWSSVAAATAAPTDKFFIKVDTSGILQGSRPTWFMGVMSAALANTNTFGMAVAGRTVCEALPMFVCARSGVAPGYGYVRGTSYLLMRSPSGSAIGPGNVGWMDPVPPGAPSLIPPGTNVLREILCRGQGYCIAPGTYSSRTQSALPQTMGALNTRFGVYQGTLNDAEHKQACPADTNVKRYLYTGPANPPEEMVVDWLTVAPTKQGLDVDEPVGGSNVVHWSAARPEAGATPAVSGGYPSAGSGVSGEFAGTPYGQTTAPYFQPPPSTLGGDPVARQAGRRILTIGIASNCGAPGLNGNGAPVEIVAFGRFFMQVEADVSGSNKGLYGEFLNMVSSPPAALPEIKLYR